MATSTSSPLNTDTPRRQINTDGACTHITSTRLWSDSFRCQICLQHGSMGWLWRCTQDTELILEEDLETEGAKKLDKYCDIFERPISPRKRSPAARASKFSFLEELNDEELKRYTSEQINTILAQRAHVCGSRDGGEHYWILTDKEKLLDKVKEQEEEQPEDHGLRIFFPNSMPPFISKRSSGSPSRISTQPVSKPWLPKKECQFKCCAYCRPTLVDRSFLSLDGITNGDVPASAIAGWGFQLRLGKQQRPIGLVKYVKNLGLRPSPPACPLTPDSDRILVGWNVCRGSRSPQFTPTPQVTITPPATDTSITSRVSTSLGPSLSPTATSNTDLTGSSAYSPEVQDIFKRMTMGPQRRYGLDRQPPLNEIDIATHALLTPQPTEELEPLTPMMQHEWRAGFGSAPLEVKSGVAMTEEAVELEVPDPIMGYGKDDENLWRNGS